MANVIPGSTVKIVGGTRPPLSMRLLVSIEAENLPGLGIEAEVSANVTWHPSDDCWDTPEVFIVEAHITRCGVRVAVTQPTVGQMAEIDRTVERFFEHAGHAEIMESGDVVNEVAA